MKNVATNFSCLMNQIVRTKLYFTREVQKVPELWYFRNFSIYLRYFVIINVI